MLKLNIKLLIDPPPKKMTVAHLSPLVDRDRRPCRSVHDHFGTYHFFGTCFSTNSEFGPLRYIYTWFGSVVVRASEKFLVHYFFSVSASKHRIF